MQKRTKSLLEELNSYGDLRDINHVIESRASNLIVSAANLIELIQKNYDPEKAELLEKKLLSAIKSKDQSRFSKAVRKK
jgi:hypothetical protein